MVAVVFLAPDSTTASSLWNVVSFPLKPLGATLMLLAVAIGKNLTM